LIFDIRGLTALSDRLAPNEVMALLAEYQAAANPHNPEARRLDRQVPRRRRDREVRGVASRRRAYAADATVALDEALVELSAGTRPNTRPVSIQ
jgi:hypothetical protein